MRLQNAHIETLKGIEAQKDIAAEQATVLSTALAMRRSTSLVARAITLSVSSMRWPSAKGIDGAIAKRANAAGGAQGSP